MCLFWCNESKKKQDEEDIEKEEKNYLITCFGCRESCVTKNVYYNSSAGLFGLCDSCNYDMSHFEL